MNVPFYSVRITKEAFERLCAVRDYLVDEVGEWISLGQVCSTIVCQVALPEDINEASA